MYYGTNLYTNEPIELDRRKLSIPTNRLICGKAGKGKTFLMKHEMLSVLSETEDTVIVMASDEIYSYSDIVKMFCGETLKMNSKNENDILITENKRIIFYDLSYMSNKLRLNAYKLCLESAFKTVCNNHRQGRMTWIFIDEINPILHDETLTELLYQIHLGARKQSCTVTLSTQFVDEINNSDIVRSLLFNTNFLTLLSIPKDDREVIYKYYEKELPKSVIDKYCDNALYGTGINIINGRLFGDEYSNEMIIPFRFKSIKNNQEVEV